MSSSSGSELIDRCKEHVLATMRRIPECAPGGTGLRSMAIEKQAGLELNLAEQNGWLTWSVLMALVAEEKVQVLRAGKRGIRYFRLLQSAMES